MYSSKQCHGICSITSCGILDSMSEAAKLSAWTLPNFLSLLTPGTNSRKSVISANNNGLKIIIDEQLLPCKSRCRFIQYMANKPDKFGIKFWLAPDVNPKYVLNDYPYLGKE